MADAQVHAVLAQGVGEKLEQVVALLEHLEDFVQVAGALAGEVVEKSRDVPPKCRLSRSPGPGVSKAGRTVSRKARSSRPQVEALEGAGDAARAQLRAHETLVEVHARELREPLVDGLVAGGTRAWSPGRTW